MATSIITRETAGGGATVKNAPLTNGEIDGNFITLAENKLEASDNLSDVSDAGTARTNLGLGTMATQDADSVAITGGSITGITDLAIDHGGTGASTVEDARDNLGLGSIATQDANSVSITGGSITGITDLAITDGGTGASSALDARNNLELGSIATEDVGTGASEFRNNSQNDTHYDSRYYQQSQVDSLIATAVPTGVITMWSGSVGSVPTGWAICDGSNGTPDLRNRFVLGAGSLYAVGATGGSKDAIVVQHSHNITVGNSGAHTHSANTNNTGAHSHTGITSNNGAHQHGGNTNYVGDHSHTYTRTWSGGFIAGSGSSYPLSPNNVQTSGAGGHGHNITTNNTGAHSHNVSTNSEGAHSHNVTIAEDGVHSHNATASSEGSSGVNANMPPYYALAFIMKL